MTTAIPKSRPLTIAIVAGEASGDLLGADLILALKQQQPHCHFIGIGGPKMIAAGCQSLFPQEKLAVRGFAEVIGKLPELLTIRRRLIKTLRTLHPDVFIGIDAPDFNFGIEKRLHRAGIATVHYVSPSIWAWRKNRVKKIVRFVDKMLCLFPMEPALYQNAGGHAVFVGHPLAQQIPITSNPQEARQHFGLKSNAHPVFTLMPGSRHSELDYLAELFLQTACRLQQYYPNAHFLLPSATISLKERLASIAQQSAYQKLNLTILDGQASHAIAAADAVLVASGTASLEVALWKRPMVIAYRIHPLTYFLVKHLIHVPFVGLPNILLNQAVVPECLQNDATVDQLSQAMRQWLEEPQRTTTLTQQFHQLHQSLNRNSGVLAAQEILSLMAQKPSAKSSHKTSTQD